MDETTNMQEVHVAICDDNASIRNQLAEFSVRFSQETHAPLRTTTFESGERLLASEIADFDLLFLDIQMPGMSGMRTAREIRTTNHELRLVFVTNYEQYAIEGYEVQAFRFLKKPIRYVQFFEIMNKIVADIHKDRSHFAVKNRSGVHHIRTSYVLYAETYRRRTLLHTIEGDVECNQSMSALERELGAQFFRCHAAYLVNLKHVQHIAPTEVVLANQVSLPISKHRRSVFLQAAMNYWGETVL